MRKIKILLSFDYELPLGGINGTYRESLFLPTQHLLDLASELNVPLNFFADVLSVSRFRELNISDYVKDFCNQMQYAAKNGHDVQLHLHPHWLATDVIDGKFIPSPKYGLGDFNSAAEIDEIIKKGIEELKTIVNDPDHKSVAFRAGGYVLSPQSKEILSALWKNGIKIDSSMSPGYFFKSNLSSVDYTTVPKKCNWKVDLNGDFTIDAKEGLFEVPIASKRKSLFEIPTALKLKKYEHRKYKSSGRMIHSAPSPLNASEKFKKYMSTRMLTFDNYTYPLSYNMDILASFIQRAPQGEAVYVSAIGHPKGMGEYALELMTYFVKQCRKKYGDQIEFVTYNQVAEEKALI